jgi:hypothetical protein
LAVTTPTLVACSSGQSADEVARDLRGPGAANTSDRALLQRELVRYAKGVRIMLLTEPSAMEKVLEYVVSGNTAQISAGIAVFVSDVSDKAHWVEAGRCYERFALQATALGIRNALLNQPVEVGAVRPQFAAAIGLGNLRPDLVVRFGRGPTLPLSMRRPVQSVLV